MKTRKYIVDRDNVYVGKVIKASSVYRANSEGVYTKPGNLYPTKYLEYRTMLFTPNENKLADDLLYDSPNYPILNITDPSICLSFISDSIAISNICNLSELLRYFKYDEKLSYHDILKIRKKFFAAGFAQNNCTLFGLKEKKAEDINFYDANGNVITDVKELKKLRNNFRKYQRNCHRIFMVDPNNHSEISREYFHTLSVLSDKTIEDFLLDNEEMDAFKPNRNELNVKKLRRL